MITLHYVKTEFGDAACGSTSTQVTLSKTQTTCPACLVKLGIMPPPAAKKTTKRSTKKGAR